MEWKYNKNRLKIHSDDFTKDKDLHLIDNVRDNVPYWLDITLWRSMEEL